MKERGNRSGCVFNTGWQTGPTYQHRLGSWFRSTRTLVKERAKELKHLKGAVMKGVKVVGDSCKRAWNKVKSIKR
ncbi:hypothetical protein E2562_038288 [Oryza meyeriana var. granulata]|uniref:Uncharacterized protein n=1 Tax=Oryza meyeriana var. granulata TaxID=110450 RepID=A0A6G1C252_9ORYZ|nr:hypothetical protein E2562_038288 [Oryza meyeriana var. granulata]